MGLGEFLILAFTLIFFGAMLAVVSSGIDTPSKHKDIEKAEKKEEKQDLDKAG